MAPNRLHHANGSGWRVCCCSFLCRPGRQPQSKEARLLAADGSAGDDFGYSVALSGNTALIGVNSSDDNVNGIDSGSAYVFTRSGATWSQHAKLTPTDGSAVDGFGGRVAMSGNTVLIGARLVDGDVKGGDSGAAYVFTGELSGDEVD